MYNAIHKCLSWMSPFINRISMWELSQKIPSDDLSLTEERRQKLHNLATLLEQSLSNFNETEPKELEGTTSQIISSK